MEFIIDNLIFEKFPQLNIGILVLRDINNHGRKDEIIDLIRQREEQIREQFSSETLSQNPG